MQNENKQLLIILLIVFIGFVGTSLAYPIFPPLFLYPMHDSIIPYAWNETSRSIFLGVALAAYPFGQFIGSSVLGGCSDRYGRKRILIFSLAGSALGYFLSAMALEFNLLWTLIISRLLTGFMEGNFAIVRAMAADLASISKYKSFGRINSMGAIGYVMGPLLGGFFSDDTLFPWFSFALPFLLAAIFSGFTVLLAGFKLYEKVHAPLSSLVSIWQRFNLIKRFSLLVKNNPSLKYLLIVSSTLSIAVDIFYEFGPVYLTGLWAMTPAWIAIYNAILSITLAIGSGWLPHKLSSHFSIKKIVINAMIVTAILFGLMTIYPTKLSAFLLFGLSGLSIAVAVTNITIQVSNAADRSIQGEAMGAQLSLRMLGDTGICLVGGFVIISSVITPLAISAVIALLAAGIFWLKIFTKSNSGI